MAIVDRVEYDGEGLVEKDLATTPLAQITAWVDEAAARQRASGDVPEPMALSVATVDGAGQPDVRTVLMRFVQPRGIGFLTNTGSAKGLQIAANDRIAASLTWPSMFRSIRFRGRAVPIGEDDVRRYFVQRPWASRISAWASDQSRPTPSRRALAEAYAQFAQRFPDYGAEDDVPVPAQWGGYWLEPHRVEFWAGRPNRLHDRLVFDLRDPAGHGDLGDAQRWDLQRLQP
ncbi:MAG: pyridoxamine 5'-phosphate oxidase [Ornithinimicrobium sp.]